MTMHVVLGDGEMPVAELKQHLTNLKDADVEADQQHWYLVQAKPEPTATDRALMKWLNDQEIYYQTVGDGSEVPDIYGNAQESYEVKRLAPKIVNLMKSLPEEGEEAHVLALFVSDDPDAEEDRWLNDVIQAVADADFKILGLNDGLIEIDLEEVEEEEEEAAAEVEEEETPVAKKAVPAKKVAAKKAAAAPAEEETAPATKSQYTRDELEEMDLGQLKEIAKGAGITLPPRTRMGTYVDAILGQMPEELETEVEIEEVEVPTEDDYAAAVTGTTMTGAITLTSGSLSASAMLVVIYNGTVVSRSITPEQAVELIGTV